MTIAVEHNRVVATGNGATTNWPFDFSVMDEGDLQVYTYEIATGTLTGPLSDTLYTVNGVPGSSGSVDYPLVGDPLENTHKIIIQRIVDLLQPSSFSNAGGFDPATLTLRLDDIVRQVQQVNDAASRAVKVDISGTDDPDGILGGLNGAVTAAEASATAAAAAQANAETAETNAEAAQAAAEAAAASVQPENLVHIADTDASGFGFVNEAGPLGDSDTTLAVESVVKAYVDAHGLLNASDFGASPSASAADNAAALNAFFAALAVAGGGGVIEPGDYDIDDTIVITGEDFSLDAYSVTLVPDAALLVAVQLGTTVNILQRVKIAGLTIDRPSYSGATENVGVLMKNLANSTFIDLYSRDSKYPIMLAPESGDRVGYNTFINARAFNGFRNLYYAPDGGWANENVWLGGRLVNSSDTEYNLYLDGGNDANENKFYGMSMEASTGITTSQAAAYMNGIANILHHPRLEGTWVAGAGVVLGSSSVRNEITTPRFDVEISDQGVGNQIFSGKQKKFGMTFTGRENLRLYRTNNPAQTALSGSPTADTTANSPVITVSDASELAIGNVISIAGAVNHARIEHINGTTVTLDRPAAVAVSGVAITRGMVPLLNLGDHVNTTGNGYGISIYAGRTGSGTILIDGYARGSKIFEILGDSTLVLGASQVLTTRRTGWTAATGTATRTTFATGSVTTAQLAERVKALIDDLITHGVIGS